MRMDLDWTVGTIRVGKKTTFLGAEPGTTYDFVCSIYLKGNEGYLYAAHGIMNRRIFTLIRQKLKSMGIEKVSYERLNTETHRQKEVLT